MSGPAWIVFVADLLFRSEPNFQRSVTFPPTKRRSVKPSSPKRSKTCFRQRVKGRARWRVYGSNGPETLFELQLSIRLAAVSNCFQCLASKLDKLISVVVVIFAPRTSRVWTINPPLNNLRLLLRGWRQQAVEAEVHGGGAVMVGPVVGEGDQCESPRCFAAAPAHSSFIGCKGDRVVRRSRSYATFPLTSSPSSQD